MMFRCAASRSMRCSSGDRPNRRSGESGAYRSRDDAAGRRPRAGSRHRARRNGARPRAGRDVCRRQRLIGRDRHGALRDRAGGLDAARRRVDVMPGARRRLHDGVAPAVADRCLVRVRYLAVGADVPVHVSGRIRRAASTAATARTMARDMAAPAVAPRVRGRCGQCSTSRAAGGHRRDDDVLPGAGASLRAWRASPRRRTPRTCLAPRRSAPSPRRRRRASSSASSARPCCAR